MRFSRMWRGSQGLRVVSLEFWMEYVGFNRLFSITFWISGICMSSKFWKRETGFHSYSPTSCCLILSKLLNSLDLWNGRISGTPLGGLSVNGSCEVLGVKYLIPEYVHQHVLNKWIGEWMRSDGASGSVSPLTHRAYMWYDCLWGEKLSDCDLMPFPPKQSWLASEGHMHHILSAPEKWWSSFVKGTL